MNLCCVNSRFPWKIYNSCPSRFISYTQLYRESWETNCLINLYKTNVSKHGKANYCCFADDISFNQDDKNNLSFVMLSNQDEDVFSVSSRVNCFIVEKKLLLYLFKLSAFLKRRKSNEIYDLSAENEVYIHCKKSLVWETFYNIFDFFLGKLNKSFIVGQFYCAIASWQLLKTEIKLMEILFDVEICMSTKEKFLVKSKQHTSNSLGKKKFEFTKKSYSDLKNKQLCDEPSTNKNNLIRRIENNYYLPQKRKAPSTNDLISQSSHVPSKKRKNAQVGVFNSFSQNSRHFNKNTEVISRENSGYEKCGDLSRNKMLKEKIKSVQICDTNAKWTVNPEATFKFSKIPSYTEYFLSYEICEKQNFPQYIQQELQEFLKWNTSQSSQIPITYKNIVADQSSEGNDAHEFNNEFESVKLSLNKSLCAIEKLNNDISLDKTQKEEIKINRICENAKWTYNPYTTFKSTRISSYIDYFLMPELFEKQDLSQDVQDKTESSEIQSSNSDNSVKQMINVSNCDNASTLEAKTFSTKPNNVYVKSNVCHEKKVDENKQFSTNQIITGTTVKDNVDLQLKSTNDFVSKADERNLNGFSEVHTHFTFNKTFNDKPHSEINSAERDETMICCVQKCSTVESKKNIDSVSFQTAFEQADDISSQNSKSMQNMSFDINAVDFKSGWESDELPINAALQVPENSVKNGQKGIKSPMFEPTCVDVNASNYALQSSQKQLDLKDCKSEEEFEAASEIHLASAGVSKFKEVFGFKGFQTASGKAVNISNDALHAAKQLLASEMAELKSNENFQGTTNMFALNIEKRQEKDAVFKGFQTACSKELNISKDALQNAQKLLTSERVDLNSAIHNMYDLESNKTYQMTNMKRNKKLKNKDLEPNKKLKMSDLEFNEDYEMEILESNEKYEKTNNMFDSNIEKIEESTNFRGSQTAAGKAVEISNDALQSAQKLLGSKMTDLRANKNHEMKNLQFDENYEMGDLEFDENYGIEIWKSSESYEKNKNMFTPNIKENQVKSNNFVGFETAAGKTIKISKDALKSAQTLFLGETTDLILNETNEKAKYMLDCSIVKSQESDNFKGFETAAGKAIKISKNALVAAEKILHEDMIDLQKSETYNFTSEDFQNMLEDDFD